MYQAGEPCSERWLCCRARSCWQPGRKSAARDDYRARKTMYPSSPLKRHRPGRHKSPCKPFRNHQWKHHIIERISAGWSSAILSILALIVRNWGIIRHLKWWNYALILLISWSLNSSTSISTSTYFPINPLFLHCELVPSLFLSMYSRLQPPVLKSSLGAQTNAAIYNFFWRLRAQVLLLSTSQQRSMMATLEGSLQHS